MKERPILFSGPMVRAILSGQKTQTRRSLKLLPGLAWYDHLGGEKEGWFCDPNGPGWWHVEEMACPYGQPGDRLWVRETWAAGACAEGLSPSMLHAPTWLRDNGGLWYQADSDRDRPGLVSRRGRWRPSIHMPRWASRITLEITSTRVERLHEITKEDAIREGVNRGDGGGGRMAFGRLWASIHGAASWDANPWVWVVSFRRLEAS